MAHLPVTEQTQIPDTHILVVSVVLLVFFFLLFIFWKKRGAKMTFIAWALFAAVLNLTLFINSLPGIEILTGQSRLFVYILLILNSIIAVVRSWQWSEKYMPKKEIAKLKKKRDHKACTHLCYWYKTSLGRTIAFLETIKNGANNDGNIDQIKKHITGKMAT